MAATDAPLTNLQARDLDSVLHPYSELHKLRDTGPTILASGKGVFVTDTQGNEYIEGMAGLWCTGLGFGDEEQPTRIANARSDEAVEGVCMVERP